MQSLQIRQPTSSNRKHCRCFHFSESFFEESAQFFIKTDVFVLFWRYYNIQQSFSPEIIDLCQNGKILHPPVVCYQLIKVCSFHDRTRMNHGKSNRSRNTSLDSLNSRICCKISAPPFRYFFILAHTLLLCMILCIQVTSYDFFLFHTRF